MNVMNRSQVAEYVTKDTSLIRELLNPASSSLRSQSLAEATLAPGGMTMAHLHPQTEEVYYILSGAGVMAVEEERRPVEAGDAIAIPPGSRHQIRNAGKTPLVLLCCCVPAYRHEDTELCASLLD